MSSTWNIRADSECGHKCLEHVVGSGFMHSPGMGTWDKRCMHGWRLLQGEVVDAPIAFPVCARGRSLERVWEMMQAEHVVGCRETSIWSVSGCWGMHGASLWNGDGYVNGMNVLGLPMPVKRGERHLAIGACIRGREHSLGGVAEVVPCI